MSEIIKDGQTGKTWRINNNNRGEVSSISTDEDKQATLLGNSFNLNTGIFTLTDDSETPIIYLKNNGDCPIHIRTIIIGTWLSTGGNGFDGVPKAVFIKNPTTGTIVSSPVNVDINSNRNYDAAKTLDADVFKGATGKTMTDGTDHIVVSISNPSTSQRTVVPIDELIPKGHSFGIKYTPPTNNTNQKIYIAIVNHLDDQKE